MASGVTVNQICLDAFQALKAQRANKYIVFQLNDDRTEVVVSKTSTSCVYNEFLRDLPEDDCRWAVYDLEFEKTGAGVRNKICFVSWSPDSAKIKSKMVYASSRDALRRALIGVAVDIQAADYDEASFEALLDKADRGA